MEGVREGESRNHRERGKKQIPYYSLSLSSLSGLRQQKQHLYHTTLFADFALSFFGN